MNRLHVFVQLVPPGERGWAHLAPERTHTVMDALMPLQVTARDERLWTALAHERLLATVDAHVLREVRVARETLLANRTRVRPDSRVHDRVLAQIRASHEALLALCADERLWESVQIAHVLLQNRALIRAEQTEDAVERLAGVVLRLLVLGAVRLVLEAQVAELAQEKRGFLIRVAF